MAARYLLFALLFYCLNAEAQSAIPQDDDVVRTEITDESGVTIETRVVIERSGDQAKITFLQETENGFIFKSVSWTGDVTLFLTNGKTIKLEDTNMKGHTMESGGYIAGYYIPNRYERFSSYFLSLEECAMLRESSIKHVEYKLDDPYNSKVQQLNVEDHDLLLKSQLNAIGL